MNKPECALLMRPSRLLPKSPSERVSDQIRIEGNYAVLWPGPPKPN